MDNDERVDRLLRRASRARDARPGNVCLDAETIAAWTDGSLTAREREAAEAHAADCDRCLAVLAAIAQTTPPSTMPERSSWFSIRWLVPFATAAVAVAAWVVMQEPMPQRPSQPAPAGIEATTPTEPTVQAERDAAEDTTSASRAANARQRADALEKKAESPAPRARSAPAPPSLQERMEARDELGHRQFGAAKLPSAMIVSPDPNIRWRIAGRTVERSIDGGRTWQRHPTGTEADLLAGSSPAPRVCWIVGQNGTVLLSTDGESWRRVDFPDPTAHLVGVTARDGDNATVTTSDGRTYRTTDAGRTWTLQEKPTTINNNETKQVSMLTGTGLTTFKRYVVNG